MFKKPLITRIINLIFFLLLIAGNVYINVTYSNAFFGFETWIQPASNAFSIWGLIYAALCAFTIFQLIPKTYSSIHNSPIFFNKAADKINSIRFLFATSCILNVTWLIVWVLTFYQVALAVIIALLINLATIYYFLHPRSETSLFKNLFNDYKSNDDALAVYTFVRFPFSIYIGWIFLATTVNLFSVVFPVDLANPGSTVLPAVVAMAVLGLLGFVFIIFLKDPVVPAVFVWGYYWINSNAIVNKYPSFADPVKQTSFILGIVLGVACLIVALTLVIKRMLAFRKISKI